MENRQHRKKNRRSAGSIDMQDAEIVFKRMQIKKGDTFLDLGCGTGEYSILASEWVGENGVVYALDRWEGLIQKINQESLKNNLQNIQAINADITVCLPIPDQSIDVCLLATVLHTLHPDDKKTRLYDEIKRTLKPEGRVAVINVKKEDQPFGPPLRMRSSPLETENLFKQCGYTRIDCLEFEYTYMIQFSQQSN